LIIETGQYAVGIVQPDIDPLGIRVRVQFPDRDNMISWWLLVIVQKSHLDKGWWFPDPGDQVVCLMDSNFEQGFVIGATYNAVDLAPGASAPSGLRLSPTEGSTPVLPLAGSTYDEMFTNAAATCPALSTALPGVFGKNVLKGLAESESSLNTNAVSPPGRNGVRCYGIMQINPIAHPGYTPQQLMADPNTNIALGTADLCARLDRGQSIQNAVAGFKGWSSYNTSAQSQAQVNAALGYMQALGTT
jgi:hypothetical protein